VFFAVWSASAGIYNLDRAIRVAYGLRPQSYLEARARALAGAVVVVMALGVIALGLPVVVGRSPGAAVFIVGVPVVLAATTAGVALLYRFSVLSGARASRFLPGAVASSIGIFVLVVGFGAYVDWSRRYTAVYGVFA
jgi:uncharacterized BrkB/YihY/UPF0761 family membrane protein